MAKLKELRMRLNESAAANRRDLVEDHQKSKVTARELARLEKQRKLAKTLRLKADAEANGEDLERRKAWEWSIEQNERWEQKQAETRERRDHTFNHANDEAHRKYEKNVRTSKPDLVGYARQKEAAMGLEPGSLVPLGLTNDMAAAGPSRNAALSAAEDLYRSADTLAYGDSKPSEDAVDRVVGKINKECVEDARELTPRKKRDESGDVTYINRANKVFNSKVAKFFDKYTGDIRANLERGTAL
ncbi:mRNA splicing factor SYF2 [Cutaneotrichosporon oleaginosum]|uniref:Pre-mRNA-splicing factor SYF2 n=1 Tax=Cutaneotrichosporon oleaginosum TaxID=879819 RepID=A0A0J0XQV6_9TREE|nr:mRNA splicing factor SYF2 [Cutaneotrichosporon oleaginosum]KLT43457.1 mRNA splicing factor SYF2 [Cutaneotrichosporon oleaginosum]